MTSAQPALFFRIWLWRFAKIVLVLAAIVLVFVTVLANIGGSSPALKQGIEDYLGALSGRPARIGTLNHIRFFPTIRIDFSDLALGADADTPVARAASAQLAFYFWDVAMGTGRVRALNIQDFTAEAGVFTPRALAVQSVQIVEGPEGEDAALTAQGRYGDAPFTLDIGMQRYGSGESVAYGFAQEKPFLLTFADMRAQGLLAPRRLADLQLFHKDSKLAEGQIDFVRTEPHVWHVTGMLRLAGHGSVLRPDLKIDHAEEPWRAAGGITGDPYDCRDFEKRAPLAAFEKMLETEAGIAPRKQGRLPWPDLAFVLPGSPPRVIPAPDFPLFSSNLCRRYP